MKIAKITIAVLASLVISAVSFAGELTVTGNAKATYTIKGSDSTTALSDGGKGIGIANEFTLSASGETDGGIAWKYAQDIDGATVQDDASLTLGIPGFGTFGIFVSEGGISSKYGWSPAVYAPGTDYGTNGNSSASTADTGASVVPFTYGDDIGGFNNFQYHTPADILPFGISAKVAYAPNTGANANASSDASGSLPNIEDGRSATQYQVNAAPIDGLAVTASYFKKNDMVTTYKYGYEAGGASAKYAIGPVTIGYGKFYVQPAVAKANATIHTLDYENTSYGIAFNVNESFAISYTKEDSDANKKTVVTGTNADTKTTVTTSVSSIQAAYTMGGMTLTVAQKGINDSDYTAGLDQKETTIAVSLAF